MCRWARAVKSNKLGAGRGERGLHDGQAAHRKTKRNLGDNEEQLANAQKLIARAFAANNY